jgi:alpha-galactosidase/6-phospho-beta-glucosidase family protein
MSKKYPKLTFNHRIDIDLSNSLDTVIENLVKIQNDLKDVDTISTPMVCVEMMDDYYGDGGSSWNETYVYYYTEETDDEYKVRVDAIKKDAREKAKLRKKEKEEIEKAEYERLKQKYGP